MFETGKMYKFFDPDNRVERKAVMVFKGKDMAVLWVDNHFHFVPFCMLVGVK